MAMTDIPLVCFVVHFGGLKANVENHGLNSEFQLCKAAKWLFSVVYIDCVYCDSGRRSAAISTSWC